MRIYDRVRKTFVNDRNIDFKFLRFIFLVLTSL